MDAMDKHERFRSAKSGNVTKSGKSVKSEKRESDPFTFVQDKLWIGHGRTRTNTDKEDEAIRIYE